ncbi:MAG: endonuclease III, partial [Firmicutes bacterium]|nr:endonuclease III [Bacillota bacterium]
MKEAKLPRLSINGVLGTLAELYPDAHCALLHKNPFELLVATMLSAQCTDKRVNEVTPRLFATYPDSAALAKADVRDVERLICECGLFKTKAKNIIASSRILVEQHGGQVPALRDALEALPGVGRKTANVVLSNAFGVPAIAVDTHVFRVANRIGLAASPQVEETERQLMRRIPRKLWSQAHHWLIYHGRQVCAARTPQCAACALAQYCHFARSSKTSGSAERRKKQKVTSAMAD